MGGTVIDAVVNRSLKNIKNGAQNKQIPQSQARLPAVRFVKIPTKMSFWFSGITN